MNDVKEWGAHAVREWMKEPPLELADDVLEEFDGMTGTLLLEVEEDDWMAAFEGTSTGKMKARCSWRFFRRFMKEFQDSHSVARTPVASTVVAAPVVPAVLPKPKVTAAKTPRSAAAAAPVPAAAAMTAPRSAAAAATARRTITVAPTALTAADRVGKPPNKAKPKTTQSTGKKRHASSAQPITLKPVKGSNAKSVSFKSKLKARTFLGIGGVEINKKMQTGTPHKGWHILAAGQGSTAIPQKPPPATVVIAKTSVGRIARKSAAASGAGVPAVASHDPTATVQYSYRAVWIGEGKPAEKQPGIFKSQRAAGKWFNCDQSTVSCRCRTGNEFTSRPGWSVARVANVGGTHPDAEPQLAATLARPRAAKASLYEAGEILDHRSQSRTLQYFTKWKGFPSTANTWEPAANLLPECSWMIAKYWGDVESQNLATQGRGSAPARSKSAPNRCQGCSKTFSSFNNLQRHIKNQVCKQAPKGKKKNFNEAQEQLQAPLLKKRRGMSQASSGSSSSAMADLVLGVDEPNKGARSLSVHKSTTGRGRGGCGKRSIILQPVGRSNAENMSFSSVVAARAFLQTDHNPNVIYNALRTGKELKGWYVVDDGLKVGNTTTYIGARTTKQQQTAVLVVPPTRSYSCTGAEYSPTALAATRNANAEVAESVEIEATVTVGEDSGKIAFYDSATYIK